MAEENIKLFESERIENGKFHFTESFNVESKVDHARLESFKVTESTGKEKMILRPRIEAIHAGKTRNGNMYPGDKLRGDFKLKSGTFSFMYPYPKPMIKNHDHHSEATGRIKNAQFIADSLSGRESILIVPEITDPDTIEKILDGRYLTVSIGANTDSMTCSICGTNVIAEGFCGHWRNETYDGEECYWIAGNLYFDECSWVNVPADTDAMVIDAGEISVMESYLQVGEKHINLSSDVQNIELKESDVALLGLTEHVGEDSKNLKEGGQRSMDKDLIEGVAEVEGAIAEDAVVTEDNVESLKTGEAILPGLEELRLEVTTLSESNSSLVVERDAALVTIEEHLVALSSKDQLLQEKDTQIEQLNSKVSELEEDKVQIESSNTELKADLHQALTEMVIEFKVALNKISPENKEEETGKHLTRSEESLRDALSDLRQEFSKITTYNQRITNPGIGSVDGENNQVIGESFKPSNTMSSETVLKNLFSGKIQ